MLHSRSLRNALSGRIHLEMLNFRKCGAQERTRTFTAVKPLAPEASASTNSTTWALGRLIRIGHALVKWLQRSQIRCTARARWRIANPLNTPKSPNSTRQEPTMASNSETLVTVFGGSGFLGRNVVRALAKRDYRIRVAVRRPELAGHLQPLGRVGQIHAVQANVRYPASVEAAMRDSHVAINLVGTLVESGAQTFDAVQTKGAETIARTAAAAGARMVHVSAIGADANSPVRLWPQQGGRRAGRAGRRALGHHPAAVAAVRAGGPVHQPLCRAGADVAVPAADRRRGDPDAAGLCRRRRQRDRRCGRRQDQGRAQLTNSAARKC